MRQKLSWVLSLGLALGVVVPGIAAGEDKAAFVVIVHSDNPASSLTAKEVSAMMLKKKTKWSDGIPVEPVDQGADSPVREAFSLAIHGRSVSGFKSYQRQIFSGGDVPPPEVGNDNAVISFVRSRPGAIGYVSASTRLPDGVKELAVSDG